MAHSAVTDRVHRLDGLIGVDTRKFVRQSLSARRVSVGTVHHVNNPVLLVAAISSCKHCGKYDDIRAD